MKTSARRLLTALLCFCLCLTLGALLPVKASADQVISKVLTTTKYTPVALMDLDLVPAGTSTSGVYIDSYYWFDVNTGYIVQKQFDTGTYRVEITLTTYDGFVFDNEVRAYLNNIPVDYVMSDDHHTMTVYRTYGAEIWAPSVLKQPGDETVDAGGFASFTATAIYNIGYQWHAVDPVSRRDYDVTDLPDIFTGVTLGPEGESKLLIGNIPAEMDGWRFYCTFLGASWAKSNSNYAVLHVRQPKVTPTPIPTPLPTPEATPLPLGELIVPDADATSAAETGQDAQAEAGADAEKEAHVHEFSNVWSFDSAMHWRECSCGERIEQGAHEMQWSVEKRASFKEPGVETGVCSVCSYSESRALPYTGMNQWLRVTVVGVGGLVALTILVLLVDSARKRAKARRAAAARAAARTEEAASQAKHVAAEKLAAKEKPAAYTGKHVKK